MSNIDEQIRDALTKEDQKLIKEISNPAGLFELVGLTFKGRQAWLNYWIYFSSPGCIRSICILCNPVSGNYRYQIQPQLGSFNNWLRLHLHHIRNCRLATNPKGRINT